MLLVMNRLVRPEQVGEAAIASEARERAARRRRQCIAQYSDNFQAIASSRGLVAELRFGLE
jgi:hypothetical protein